MSASFYYEYFKKAQMLSFKVPRDEAKYRGLVGKNLGVLSFRLK